MKFHLAQFLIITVLVASCRKDEVAVVPCQTTWVDISSFDTIQPNEYLAYWPGSWWEYDNGSIDSSLYWVKFPIQSTQVSGSCTIITSDTVIVPEVRIHVPFNNWPGYYFILENFLYKNDIPSESFEYWNDVDSSWLVAAYKSYAGTSNEGWTTLTRDKLQFLDSLSVAGTMFYDIFKIEAKTEFSSLTNFEQAYQRLYYAKDVGLVRYEAGDPQYQDTIDLINYYIAPH